MLAGLTDKHTINHQEIEWIKMAKKDPGAFRPLYEAYFKKIYLFMLRRVNDKDLASDLSQQVFLKALLNIGRYEFRGIPFSVWLFRIAINQCNEFFRKSKHIRTVVLEEEWVEKFYEVISADQTMTEWEIRLPSILQRLSHDDLQIIELRFFEGRSFGEIGELIGVSETYAKVKNYRILKRMKKLFLETK